MLALAAVFCVICLSLYLWHVDRTVTTAPPERTKDCQPWWTKQEVREAYQKAQTSPTDVKPFLFSKKNRRYVVTGGSGLVGGWIVNHLLMRGEDPAAIRIVDLTPTTRKEAVEANIDFVKTDVSDMDAVVKAFQKPWPNHVKSLPLTVFHCVAYINASDRARDFLPMYVKVNVLGTKTVLEAARAAKASCFVATSSSSIAVEPPTFFPWPWQRWPKNINQLKPNAEPKRLDAPLEDFSSCYAWSKAQAEMMVRDANSPQTNFLTGAIRPGHAIYGHGVDNPSSITWSYLSRGGSPTWIREVVTQFVHAQNVSIGHLAYEDALINKTNPGGKAYCVTDPNPPVRYGHLYDALEILAHPLTPMSFKPIPHVGMLLLAFTLEFYTLARHRYFSFLPKLKGDLASVQPAMFRMCAVHVVYTDTAAQREIGYRAPIKTMEGFALALVDWNQKVEERTRKKVHQGKGGEVQVQEIEVVPKGPNVH